MDENEIIEKLSSYFKLSGSEAENIYKDIFKEEKENENKRSNGKGKSIVRHYINYNNGWNNEYELDETPSQADEDQLELEYDSFTGHRFQIKQKIRQEENNKNGASEVIHLQDTPASPELNLIEQSESSESAPKEDTKHISDDNSYYIWYKDAESNEAETETLSYEYELLYQAAKETEYQSKMKIYAASFVFFFSFVLVMLILSPVIYKKYFVTEDFQSLEQMLSESDRKNEQTAVPINSNNFPITEVKDAYPSLSHDKGDENIPRGLKEQDVPMIENEKTLPEKKEESVITQQEPQDLRKTSNGWADNKYNVLYFQLENGRFTIQESSWDSYEKAGKRKTELESLGISGLKGSIEESDLGTKGKWYRVRIGEFTTLDEARKKVERFVKL